MSDASSGERRPLVNDLVAMKLKEFAARHCPNITGDALSSAIDEILGVEEVATELLAAPSSAEPHATDASEKQNVANQSTAPKVDLRLSLSFKHDCMAMGCQDVECTLCQFNPIRACSRNFRKKYLVGDSLMATCGAPLKIQLKTADGELCEDVSLPGFQLEASLIDGVAFKEKGGDFNILSKEEIQSCVKFTNHGDEPLLQSTSDAPGSSCKVDEPLLQSTSDAPGSSCKVDEPLLQSTSGAPVSSSKVVMSITNGFAVLPDVHVSESSEALLTGGICGINEACSNEASQTKPSQAMDGHIAAQHQPFTCRTLLSQVATRRVKQANTAEIPLMDHIATQHQLFTCPTLLSQVATRRVKQANTAEIPLMDHIATQHQLFTCPTLLSQVATRRVKQANTAEIPLMDHIATQHQLFTCPTLLSQVATRRVKQANKAEIPLMDDHISKIEHIGRETVKKLMVLRNAAADSGYPLDLPNSLTSITTGGSLGVSTLYCSRGSPVLPNSLTSITTVGQFVELVGIAEKDGQMKKVLQVILKLSKEKWEEAAAHALTAVMPDFRKRVWFPPGDSTHGILFTCKYGAVLLKDQV
eukprot:gene31265-6408_t